MFTCHIIRHAEKQPGDFYNPVLRHQDQPISKNGQQQARDLVSYFCNCQVSAIYVSAYQRTKQTIEPLAQQIGLEPVVDARLNEIDNGQLDGMSEEQVEASYPEFWKAYRGRTGDFRFPGGETGTEVSERVLDFLTEKRLRHGDAHILAVTHDGLIRQLVCAILDLPVIKRQDLCMDTCGITEIRFHPVFNAWQLIRMNQVIRHSGLLAGL